MLIIHLTYFDFFQVLWFFCLFQISIMSLIRHGVRGIYGTFLDASHSPLALSQCFWLSTSSNHSIQTVVKQQQSSFEREAFELSKFIDSLCNPNAFKRRPNAVVTPKRMGMDVAAVSFLDSLNLTKENISKNVISQFSKEVYKMSSVQLTQLLTAIYVREIGHPVLVNHICIALQDRSLPSSLPHIGQIAYCLSKLSFLDKPLLNRIKEQFILCAQNEYISTIVLSHIVTSFAFFRLTDRRFWHQIIKIIETLANQSELNDVTLINCINSLATVNIHPKFVSSIVERAKNLKREEMFLGKWLQLVHSLAILNSMDAQMAETVLNQRFFGIINRRNKQISEHLVQWNAISYRNIATSARLELPKDKVPPIDDAFVTDTNPKSFQLVRDIKRGEQKHHPLLERFELMLRLVAPLNSLSTPQEWHKTGAFLEGRCFVDTAQRQLIPLKDVDTNSNTREVAVLLLMDRHFTQSFGPIAEKGLDRPTGVNQMNIRHLKLVGIHPIVFTEQHFRELGNDERSQIKFIREKILSLSEEFHSNEWAEE